jgi:hypothetical protein
MSRKAFSRWGAGLTAGELAQAIAAVGMFDQPLGSVSEVPPRVTRQLDDGRLLRISASSIAEVTVTSYPVASARDYIGLWGNVQRYVRLSDVPLLRLALVPAPAGEDPPGLALEWLAEQLGRGEVGASSVCVVREVAGLEVGWNWPMRIGVLSGRESDALRALLDKRPWRHLGEVVAADQGDGECDLLLLDGDLRSALAQVLARPQRLSADCTIVLGEAASAGPRAERLVAALRTEARTSGIAVVGIEPAKRREWLRTLLQELSHNMPLDVALWRASDKSKAPQPHLEFSENLLRYARLGETASRLADHLESLGAPPDAAAAASREDDLLRGGKEIGMIGTALRNVSVDGPFDSEMGDASAIADLAKKAEARMGPIRLAKKNGAPAPAPKPGADERRVNFDLYDVTHPAQLKLEGKPLERARHYRLDLSIGFPRKDGSSAAEAFPVDKLPPSETGHELTVVFCPLSRDTRGERPEPQTASLFLPPQGETGTVGFPFDTLAAADRFDARVIVAFRNRIIQTLMFSAGVAAGAPAALKAETVVSTDLNALAYRSRVDASIVVNHSPAGIAGATALSGGEVRYVELPATEKIVGRIREVLDKLAKKPEPYKNLDDTELRELIFKLATYGKLIWNELGPAARKLLGDAAALQVVDARPGAYLPIEFFFSDELPAEAKKLCPRAPEFLEKDRPHKECPHYGDGGFQCPLHFWGLQRVIERQAVYATDEGLGAFRLSSPKPEKTRIDALRGALLGASERVRTPDLAKVEDALASKKVPLRRVKDWAAWRTGIRERSPTLLVLLPHSDHPEGFDDIEALEIGGGFLHLASLSAKDIVGPQSPHPVVFLLGCSTGLTQIPFANFVSYVRKLEAALVVGTLSPVSGRRAAAFVTEMIGALAAGNVSFGQAFLNVRRKLLASGNGFALTLIAYGDVDWTV